MSPILSEYILVWLPMNPAYIITITKIVGDFYSLYMGQPLLQTNSFPVAWAIPLSQTSRDPVTWALPLPKVCVAKLK